MTADTIAVAVSEATSGQSLHEKLAAALSFPDYYGKNWDAFWDCITDPGQSVMHRRLIIKGFNVLQERLPREANLLRRCLLDCQRENSEFEVVFERV
jgi:RNAse (barnase) inhibitor barstar